MGLGKEVDFFESELAAFRKLPNLTMVDSGSNALFMAVTLLDLPPASEIIVPSFTWVSCAQAVLMAGHIPVFCDVDLDSMNVTAETVAPKITSKTGAVMVVHYAGLPVNMEAILSFGLPVIEDAAHAVNSEYQGQACGSIGSVGIFSFDSVKNLAVGEGGGLTTTLGPEVVDRARQLRYCGIGKSGFQAASSGEQAQNARWWEYNISEPFIKMLPTNIAGALGRVQLSRLKELQGRREKIWNYFQRELSGVGDLLLPRDASVGDRHSFFTYAVRLKHRDQFARFMLENNVYTTLRYHPLHLNPIYGQTDISLPSSELLNETALSLPLHPRMSDQDVDMVVSKTKEFFGK
jgi:aminotransferase